jgi:hypothetical protein
MKNSPYLDRPLLPLAVALPRMLEKIEADLATAGAAETRRLHQDPSRCGSPRRPEEFGRQRPGPRCGGLVCRTGGNAPRGEVLLR